MIRTQRFSAACLHSPNPRQTGTPPKHRPETEAIARQPRPLRATIPQRLNVPVADRFYSRSLRMGANKKTAITSQLAMKSALT